MTEAAPRKPPKKKTPPPPARTPGPVRNRRVKNVPLEPAKRVHIERDGTESAWPAAEVELRATSELQPYENNPRVHDGSQIERLMTSIRRWGFTMPLLVDETGTLLAGHARLEAAKRLELRRVPVMIARGWNVEQRRAYVIADNQLAMLSSWDRDVLAREMQLISDQELLGSLGFTDADLRALCDPDDLLGPPAEGSATALDHRFLLLLEFDDEPTLQKEFDAAQARGLKVKVMS